MSDDDQKRPRRHARREFAEVEDDRCPKCGVACGHARDCSILLGDLYVEAARSHMEAEQRVAVAETNLAGVQIELSLLTQQRDFLTGQVNSLMQRLAGAHVAAGLIDMAGAQGFVLKETLPINQVLQQIAASQGPSDG